MIDAAEPFARPARRGGIAVFAHIGGFIAGMLLIRLFPSRQRWRHWYEES